MCYKGENSYDKAEVDKSDLQTLKLITIGGLIEVIRIHN